VKNVGSIVIQMPLKLKNKQENPAAVADQRNNKNGS
jgi:hypothetical protein